jgi:LysR family transcriptional activator of nhaA
MSSHWLNYHHLYYFMTIAELNSISKASEKLRLGQPTLSAQLRLFEDSIGVQLFERHHKRLVLTEHGKIALEYAQHIFKMGGEMYEALHDRSRPGKIHVQLGALDSIAKNVMLQLTQAALKIAPCSVSLVEGRFDELMQDLSSHKIDLCISNFLPNIKASKGMFHKVVSSRPVGIYGSPKFKHLRKGFPGSISGMPLVIPNYDSQLRYDLDHWLKINELSVDVVAETQDSALKKLMAADSMAMIPAASHTVQKQVLAGELMLIGELKNVSEELYLISAHRKITNPVAAELIKTFVL